MNFIEMSVKMPTDSSPTLQKVGEAQSVPLQSADPQGAKEPGHKVPPLIRLQVWHFSKTGRNFGFTRLLANALSKVELAGWVIQPTNSASFTKNRRDEFVPAEVDFNYQPLFREISSSDPEELIRVFFHDTLPPIIRDFFTELGKEAHYLTMFPFGESIDRNLIGKYTHCRLLYSHQISHADEHTRKLAYSRIAELPLRALPGRDMSDEWLSVGTWLSRMAITTGHVRVFSKSLRQTSYDRSCVAFKCYQELENVIELDTKKLLKPGVVGNQDLYLSIAQMAIAFQIVPFYRKERGVYLKQFFNTTLRTICLASPVASLLVCVFFWVKHKEYQGLNWDWAMDRWGHYEKGYSYTIYWKNSLVVLLLSVLVALINLAEYYTLKFFNKKTDKKINDLRVKQGALASKFCVRVLKMPPEIMTMTERKSVLYGLGVNFFDEAPEIQHRTLEAFLAKLG
ncbi:hypothetical protein BHE90_012838 [Fusarium euwallaceae]|uniref:Uncharacterized protein n=1 Tax=Fusarium euwallaceae TaxID=1147111 RepID=A0A430LAG3_9HYPO|nr:hypothetical protein BHE90_012838 [Fusarium euwallaceae]